MDYTIPEFLKDDLFFGELSSRIDETLGCYNFASFPQFKGLSYDDISRRFKAYLGYLYLQEEDEIGQTIFLTLIRSKEPDIALKPIIKNYISIEESSQISDIQKLYQSNKNKYFALIRNSMTQEFLDLTKTLNDSYLKEVKKYVKDNQLDVNIGMLTSLTKCAIIESKKNPKLEMRFTAVVDAIDYAYTLYKEQYVSYEDKKEKINKEKVIAERIIEVMECNDFSR